MALEIDQGDGGIISCAEDLIKWNSVFYEGRILPPDVLNLMLAKHQKIPGKADAPADFYGYGVVCTESPIGDVYGHGGSIPGYRTRIEYAPSLKLTVVSFSNVSFDFSSIQKERDTIRKELSHIEDEMESQEEFDKIFKTRYPQVVELMEKHTLPHLKDLCVVD